MSGYTVYLDSDFNPVAKEQATLIKRVTDDGGVIFYHRAPSTPPANTTKAARSPDFIIAAPSDPPAETPDDTEIRD